jgi:hypothetical protein
MVHMKRTKIFVLDFEEIWSQEWLRWREPAEI